MGDFEEAETYVSPRTNAQPEEPSEVAEVHELYSSCLHAFGHRHAAVRWLSMFPAVVRRGEFVEINAVLQTLLQQPA